MKKTTKLKCPYKYQDFDRCPKCRIYLNHNEKKCPECKKDIKELYMDNVKNGKFA